VVISTVEEFDRRLQEWEQFYNYHRPHGSRDGQTLTSAWEIAWDSSVTDEWRTYMCLSPPHVRDIVQL